MSLRRGLARFVPCALAALGCSSDNTGAFAPPGTDGGLSDRADVPTDRRDASAPAPILVGVVPDHGSFLGGTEVTLRGSNFVDGAEVRFGGALVQPRFTRFVDRNRIVVTTPGNRPGLVDIEVRANERTTVLPQGYRYDAFYVDPGLGPVTGNARVQIHGLGTMFADGMSIDFDGMPCTDVRVTGAELASCLTPAHPDGRVPVTVRFGAENITVPDAYQYANTADAVGGGLSGGTLAGSLTVTVINTMTGGPVPQAFVFLNNEPSAMPPGAGRTGDTGQVTLSPAMITPPITVTASARCFTTTTIQSFDARNATIYLTPLMTPECGSPGMPPPGDPQRAVYPGRVRGELVWAGPNEFAPNPWSNVPAARAGERHVAYVYATRPEIFTPDYPAATAARFQNRLLEVVPEDYGGRGYPFDFAVRPGAIAVYALAGIERVTTDVTQRRFVPYMMGVARGILASPVNPMTPNEGVVDHIVIDMNIALDHETPLEVSAYPVAPGMTQPNIFHASAFVDLGGEGVIPRPDLTVTGSRDGEYRFSGLPAFTGTLADARLKIHARYASGAVTGPQTFQDTPAPCSGLILGGITTPDETVQVRGWMGIPDITSPMQGGALPSDRTVRFSVDPMLAAADLLILTMQWDGNSWQHLAPGAERAITYPNLSSLMGLADLPSGSLLGLSLVGVRIPGFDFNRFTYATIGQAYWSAYAGRGTYVTR